MTRTTTRLFNILITLLVLPIYTQQKSIATKNTDCSYRSSNYSIEWTYDELSNDIVFKLSAYSTFDSFYTAVAFGNENPSDVVTVYVRSGRIGLIDGHLAEDGAIESDEKTNVQALEFDLQNNILTAQFARPIETLDPEDADLGSCFNMYFQSETKEIITGVPLELGNNLHKLRICDVAVTCATKMHNDLVKREEDEQPCASGGLSQKNRILWKVDGDRVVFDVYQNAKKGKYWSAIGVGQSMEDLNMILMFAENGKLKNQGLYRTEGKMQPVMMADVHELKKEKALTNNGKAHFTLSVDKKFLTEREDDKGCIPLQIALLAGQYNPGFTIQKHQNTPEAFVVCNLDRCDGKAEPEPIIDNGTGGEVEETPVIEDTKGEEPKVEEEINKHLEPEHGDDVTMRTTMSKDAQPVDEFMKTAATIMKNVEEGNGGLTNTPTNKHLEPEHGDDILTSTTISVVHIDEIIKKPEDNGFQTDDKVVEASGVDPTVMTTIATQPTTTTEVPKVDIISTMEGSGAGSQPIESIEKPVERYESTPKPTEEEKPLTSDDAPKHIDGNDTTSTLKPNNMTLIDDETPPVVEDVKPDKQGNNGCGNEHEDLKICESYFAEYLSKVNEWSDRHNMTMTTHMWKACTLLSQVQHVTTMCCTIFRNTCATHLHL